MKTNLNTAFAVTLVVGVMTSLVATSDRAKTLDEMSIAAGRQWPIL